MAVGAANILAEVVLDAQRAVQEWQEFAAGGKKALNEVAREAQSTSGKVKRSMADMQRGMENFGKSAIATGRTMRNWGAGITAAVTVPLSLLGKQAISAWQEQADAIAQVDAVLKSTGGVAGRTSKQLQAMSSELQSVSNFGDEAILRMQGILLTFTKIQGSTFDQATQSILDMASALGMDLQSAAIQVGKALNDPVLGVTALGRAGVQFTEQQKEMIKSLVETGQVGKAQAIILKELQTQFGGMAKALSETDAGQWNQGMMALGDAMEEVGRVLSPLMVKLAKFIKEAALWFQGLSDSAKGWIVAIGGVAAAMGPLLVTVGLMTMGLGGMANGVSLLITAFGRLKPVLTAIRAAFAATALAGLAAFGPASLILIGIGLLAAGLFVLSRRQSTAKRSADEHKKSISELREALQKVKEGTPVEEIKDLTNAHLAAAEAAYQNAKAQMAFVEAEREIAAGFPQRPGFVGTESDRAFRAAQERLQRTHREFAQVRREIDAISVAAVQSSGSVDAIGDGVEGVGDKTERATGKIIRMVKGGVETFVELGGAATAAGDAAEGAADKTAKEFETAKGRLGELNKELQQLHRERPTREPIEQMRADHAEAMTDMVQGMREYGREAQQSLRDAADNVRDLKAEYQEMLGEFDEKRPERVEKQLTEEERYQQRLKEWRERRAEHEKRLAEQREKIAAAERAEEELKLKVAAEAAKKNEERAKLEKAQIEERKQAEQDYQQQMLAFFEKLTGLEKERNQLTKEMGGTGGPQIIDVTALREAQAEMGKTVQLVKGGVESFTGLSQAISETGPKATAAGEEMAQMGTQAGTAVEEVKAKAISIIESLKQVGQTTSEVVLATVQTINQAFTDLLTEVSTIVNNIALNIKMAFGSAAEGATQVFITSFDRIRAELVSLYNAIQSLFGESGTIVASFLNNTLPVLDQFTVAISTAFADVVNSIQGSFNTLTASVSASISRLVSELSRLRAAISAAQAVAAQAGGGGGAGYSRGGPVYGAGGPTSDKIRAWLSNGEYVISAAAVRKYGKDFFDWVNARKFAQGGWIQSTHSQPSKPTSSPMNSVADLSAGFSYMGRWQSSLSQALGNIQTHIRYGLHNKARLNMMVDVFSKVLDSNFSAIDLNLTWIRQLNSELSRWVGQARSIISNLMAAVKKLESALAKMGKDSGAAKAAGGMVRGPGGPTSDRIRAWLSNGEYVIKAAAVRRYGAGFFDMLNNMKVPGLNLGGLVMPNLTHHFAEGGLVGRGRDEGPYAIVNLTLGDQVFGGLMAPRETADRLIRYARSEQVRKAGNKPGWYR